MLCLSTMAWMGWTLDWPNQSLHLYRTCQLKVLTNKQKTQMHIKQIQKLLQYMYTNLKKNTARQYIFKNKIIGEIAKQYVYTLCVCTVHHMYAFLNFKATLEPINQV